MLVELQMTVAMTVDFVTVHHLVYLKYLPLEGRLRAHYNLS